MKCKIPEISWHNRDPVLSVDIQPFSNKLSDKNGSYRLASGGTDSHVLIWYMTVNESDSVNLDLAADLTRHQRAVNCIKWSPNGEYLASGDDESVIFIWTLRSETEPPNIMDETNEQRNKENWVTKKILRGHMEDVYDLSWSSNSQFLVSGSVDNKAIIWDIKKGKSLLILHDHKGFVQGVSWDPLNQYIATMSTDRYLRVFDIQTGKMICRSGKCTIPVPEDHEFYEKRMRIYHDDTLQTFFRRLTFSPDGKLIVVPAGVTDFDGVTKPLNTTYIYSRYSLKQPLIILPSPDQYTIAVRFCPRLFKLRPHSENNKPVISLPYRMIFAIATKSSVYLYDTQQKVPFGLISNIHYMRLTDLTWSSDGKILIVSSTDGFCSLITFSEKELGEFYEEVNDESDKNVITANDKTASQNDEKNNSTEEELKASTIEIRKKPRPEKSHKDVIANETTSESIKKNDKKNIVDNSDVEMENTDDKILKTTESENPSKQRSEENTKLTTPETNDDVKMMEIPAENLQKKEQTYLTDAVKIPSTLKDNIILDKNIISSDEKFFSPEKKTRPITPISVRRYPRSNSSTPSVFSPEINKSETSTNSNKLTTKTPNSSLKEAKPIAIRRHPRSLVPAMEAVDKITITEEAMDSWPLNKLPSFSDEEKQKEQLEIDSSKNLLVTNKAKEEDFPPESTTDDIHLIYEESQEEDSKAISAPAPSTSATKTPRRVELKTISIPKSKKQNQN